MKNLLRSVLVLFLAASTAAGCAATMAAIPLVLASVQAADIAINMMEAFANAFFRAKPDAAGQKQCDLAFAKARTALAAVVDLVNGSKAADQGQLDLAFANFEKAYNELTSLLGPYGVHVGGALRASPGGLEVPPAALLLRGGRS